MGRPSSGYHLANGKRVPGVTTIAKLGMDSGGLVHAAWALGMEGRNYRDEWYGTAASAGTLAHSMVELYIDGGDPEGALAVAGLTFTEEMVTLARTSFGAFREWWGEGRFTVVAQEVSLVSEQYAFGGTIDAIAIHSESGKTRILDWKTGGVYEQALIQVRAYGQLVEEAGMGKIDGGYDVVRFDKATGDFVHRYFPELDLAWEAFKRQRELYDLLKPLKKRAK